MSNVFRRNLWVIIVLCSGLTGKGQAICSADNYKERFLKQYKDLVGISGGTSTDRFARRKLPDLPKVINIPVVVHVLYHTAEEMIPDSLIMDQIDQTNKDFTANNPDTSLVPSYFKRYIANCGFRLMVMKIIPKYTKMKVFYCGEKDKRKAQFDPIKFNETNGDDGWASTQVLNIWIGNVAKSPFETNLLGYGTYPGKQNAFDGIVLSYKAVGANNGKNYNSCGRTLTHELGHWLNIYHLWGDSHCGDDFVGDTPVQETYSAGLPEFPQRSCDNTEGGIMFMNFMDYTNGDGMVMFTEGQKSRMRELFLEGGLRASIMQVSFAGNFTERDSTRRNDIFTPVIAKVHTLAGQKDKVDQLVSWRKGGQVDEYIVEARKLGAEKWEEYKSRKSQIILKGLKARSVYEVRVKALLPNETITTSSNPYVFETGK
jgi:hypothetical protein